MKSTIMAGLFANNIYLLTHHFEAIGWAPEERDRRHPGENARSMYDAIDLSPVGDPETRFMTTRDGVRLAADIYRPAGEGPFPVLMIRQAYGRRIASTLCYAHPAWYAAQGYIVVVQDVRGRGDSEGRLTILEHEAEDGAEAIDWAAGLEGSTGAVGMYGFSYQGVNQLLAAAKAGPALKALAPAMIGWDVRTDGAYENGAFNLAGNLSWAVQMAAETARLAGDEAAFDELYAISRNVPFAGPNPADPAFMRRWRAFSHYYDWLDQPGDAPYWRAISPSTHAEALAARNLPMLFVGGWFDSHLPGTLAGYKVMAAGGRAKLAVGPWTHLPWDRRVGGLDFGPEAVTDIDRLQVRWFDHWLKRIDNGIDREPPVGLFDMGANRWRDFADWPGAPMRLHLSSDGRASVDQEAGTLGPAPAAAAVDHMVGDPWRPSPSFGGAYGSPWGPVDRSQVDARGDVLTYTTAPLAEPLALAGDVSVELHVSSDAPHFDVGATLSRVTLGGQVFQISEGYRSGPAPTTQALVLPLRPTCATLQPGERLRLSLAAASFPAHPVNPGTGERPELSRLSQARIVTVAVRSGEGAASALILSVDRSA